MFKGLLSMVAMGCLLVSSLVPGAAAQEKRGPSTPEERRQALDNIHEWQADPLGPNAKDEFGEVFKWVADVPDITVHVCMLLDKLPKGDKKHSSTIFGAAVMAQTAYVLENPDKRDDLNAEYLAGVEGSLRVYEKLLKADAKDRQPYLDELLQRRDAGTLPQFVAERAPAVCKN